jgi:hypothetical protein
MRASQDDGMQVPKMACIACFHVKVPKKSENFEKIRNIEIQGKISRGIKK